MGDASQVCPRCWGYGLVANETYPGEFDMSKCRTCKGKGRIKATPQARHSISGAKRERT